jgi:hypothetical protein
MTPHDKAIAEQGRGAPVNHLEEIAWYQHGGLVWW